MNHQQATQAALDKRTNAAHTLATRAAYGATTNYDHPACIAYRAADDEVRDTFAALARELSRPLATV